jgi:hypothetical protein
MAPGRVPVELLGQVAAERVLDKVALATAAFLPVHHPAEHEADSHKDNRLGRHRDHHIGVPVVDGKIQSINKTDGYSGSQAPLEAEPEGGQQQGEKEKFPVQKMGAPLARQRDKVQQGHCRNQQRDQDRSEWPLFHRHSSLRFWPGWRYMPETCMLLKGLFNPPARHISPGRGRVS